MKPSINCASTLPILLLLSSFQFQLPSSNFRFTHLFNTHKLIFSTNFDVIKFLQ